MVQLIGSFLVIVPSVIVISIIIVVVVLVIKEALKGDSIARMYLMVLLVMFVLAGMFLTGDYLLNLETNEVTKTEVK